MGKRKYYVIHRQDEGDGYDTTILYVGTNWKAVVSRYRFLFEEIRDMDFDGRDRDDLEIDYPNNLEQKVMQPGDVVWANVNDNNCYYTSLIISCMTTEHFWNNNVEGRYKNMNPQAKH